MKSFKLILVLALGFYFTSCDKVDKPLPIAGAKYDISLYPGNYQEDYVYPSFDNNTNTNRNVLLEDFTGHQCGNCPQAATIAKSIEAANAGRVFSVAMHAGSGGISSFQRTYKPGDSNYPKYNRDFTNPDTRAYTVDIPGFLGNPSGTVNRIPNAGASTIWQFSTTWQQNINALIAENNLSADLQIATNYYPATRGLFLHVECETKKALTGNYHLVIYLIQNKIIDWQKNYSVFPQDIEDYEHHQVHISNINGTWGVRVFEGNTSANFKIREDYTFKIPEIVKDTDMSVVAYIMNADTYEILQVIKKDI